MGGSSHGHERSSRNLDSTFNSYNTLKLQDLFSLRSFHFGKLCRKTRTIVSPELQSFVDAFYPTPV
jgi:hypothetical protein